jgi:hypothetical protein
VHAKILTTPWVMTDQQNFGDLAALVRRKYTAVSFQVQNGDAIKDFDLEPARAAGLSPGVWGVTYGIDNKQDASTFYRHGKALGAQAVRFDADHVQMDAEMCAKGTRSYRGLYPIVLGIQDAGWDGPIHLNTLGAPSNPMVNDFEIDIKSFLDTGGGIIAQAYYNDYVEYRPDLCKLYWLRMGVPADRLNLMLGLYPGKRGKISGANWVDLLTQAGTTKAFSIFQAQHASEYDYTDLEVLTLAARTSTEARAEIAEIAREWESRQTSDTSTSRLTVARRIADAGDTDPKWNAAKGPVVSALNGASVPA